jgi:tetratricopeptide (TPR) repeat protein/DNA-binding CsgD family transcriptional regulator
MMGYHEMAIMNYNMALKIFRETHDEAEIYSTLNNIGTVYFKWGEYEKAIYYYEQTLEFDKQQGDDDNLSVTYNNIGKVYHSWKKYQLAIDYFTLSLKHARATGRSNIEAVKLSNLGMTYFEMGELDTALVYVSKALELDKRTGNKFKIAIRKSEMAKILAARGAFTKAIEYSLSALAFFVKANILESQAIVLKDLGDFYKETKSFGKSKDSYLKSIEISEDIGSAFQAMIASKQLSLLYEEWNKPVEALLYYKKYEALNTSIFNKEKHKQLADFEIKYQTREKELENQLLKDENKQKQSRLIYLTFALAGLLLLIVLLFYGIRAKTKSIRQQKALSELELQAKENEKQHFADKVFAEKQINRLQQQQYKANIEHKNQRLANSTLDLIQKNEFLITLKNKISSTGQDTELTKKEIISLINQNIDIDQNWKKFRYDFNQTHPGFFDKLKAKFPDLSETYTQLCAFLRIGLSSKEIAQLQNVSDSAINKNRQRLRKKLGLEAETDLTAFLKELA